MRKRVKKPVCPNCGHQLQEADNFCPECGQENHTHQLPLKHFALEFVESVFHFDTKLLNTVRDLILKPGEVTKNFNDNKRARYVPPFRFYLFTSAIYFLVLASMQPPKVKLVDPSKGETPSGFNFTTSEFTDQEKEELRILSKKEDVSWADLRVFLARHQKEADWRNLLTARIVLQIFKETDDEHGELGHKVLKNISYMMFLLMPLFALLLYLFYRKKQPYYAGQLVFSVHLHTLAFILLLVALLLSLVHINLGAIVLLAILIYLFLSLKKVFGESWVKTILKGITLTACYLVLFVGSVLLALVGSLF